MVIEDIMSNEADTEGIEMDGKNFSFMEKRCCMIIQGSFENVADRLLLNNEDSIKLSRGGIAPNFYTDTTSLCATAL